MAKKEKQNKKSDTEMTESVDSMLNNMDFTTPEKDKDVDESSDQEKIDSLSSTTEKDTDTEAEKGHPERTKPHREATIVYKDREEEKEEEKVVVEEVKPTIPTIEKEKEPEIEEVIQYEDANGNIVNEDGSPIIEEPPSEVEVLQQQVAALQASLNSTATGVPIEQETTSTEPEPEPTPTEQIQRQTIAPSPLTDEVMEEIINGNKDALAGYVAQAVEIARQQTLMEIGTIVGNHIKVSNTFDNFFANPNNSDLLPVIDFVKSRLIKLERSNPTLALPELLEKTAVEVRSSMGMVNQQTETEAEIGSKVTRKIIRRKVSTGKNGGTAPGTRARRQVIEKQEPSNTLDDKLNEMALSNRE